MLSLQITPSPHVIGEKPRAQDFKKYLQRAAQYHLPAFPVQDAKIDLIFLTSAEIQNLNKKYRGKNKPTDVLSFQLPLLAEFSEKIPLFGEIYICPEIAEKQAKAQGHTLQKELNILFVHGLLHLLGYDHENDSDFLEMHALEKAILNEK